MAQDEDVRAAVFKRVVGCEAPEIVVGLKHNGDDWGFFLKVACLIESASKRSIGIRLGVDPDSESVARLTFDNAINLARESGLLGEDAYQFADKIRHVRNDLVHSGGVLGFKLDAVAPKGKLAKYQAAADAFVRGFDAADKSGPQKLYYGLVAFVLELCAKLYGAYPDPALVPIPQSFVTATDTSRPAAGSAEAEA